MNKLLLISCLLLFSPVLSAQCPELPEISAFLGDGQEISWDTAYFKKDAMEEVLAHYTEIDGSHPTFMTPILANGFRLFYPGCDKRTDTTEYRLSVELYNKEHHTSYSTSFKNRKQVIDSILQNFSKMCLNDTLFGHMVALFKSEPYFGRSLDEPVMLVFSDSISLPVGTLKAYQTDYGIALSMAAKNRSGYMIIIEERNYKKGVANFGKFRQHYLGYVVNLQTSGIGSLELHFDSNGRFRFYQVDMF